MAQQPSLPEYQASLADASTWIPMDNYEIHPDFPDEEADLIMTAETFPGAVHVAFGVRKESLVASPFLQSLAAIVYPEEYWDNIPVYHMSDRPAVLEAVLRSAQNQTACIVAPENMEPWRHSFAIYIAARRYGLLDLAGRSAALLM